LTGWRYGGALLEQETLPGTTGGGWRLSPARRAATELCRTGAYSTSSTSQLPAADRLHAHQARGDRRPSALPPVLLAAPSSADRPPARQERRRRPALLPRARLRRGARRLGGATTALLFAGPPSSMARLSRFQQKLAGECCWSTSLPEASCAAGELICRRAGRGTSSGPEKLRPQEAALDLDTKAGGEGQGGRGAGVRPGCGAGVWCNVRTK